MGYEISILFYFYINKHSNEQTNKHKISSTFKKPTFPFLITFDLSTKKNHIGQDRISICSI